MNVRANLPYLSYLHLYHLQLLCITWNKIGLGPSICLSALLWLRYWVAHSHNECEEKSGEKLYDRQKKPIGGKFLRLKYSFDISYLKENQVKMPLVVQEEGSFQHILRYVL